MNNTITSRYALALLAAIALVMAVSSGCGRPNNDETRHFPQRLRDRVELPVADKNEEMRNVNYWPDNKTPMEVRIERKDGFVRFQMFRPDGTMREAREFYPAPGKAAAGSVAEASSTRQLKSHFVIAADGVKVDEVEQYRADGTMTLKGKRLPNGMFEQVAFHEDGRSTAGIALMAADGSLLTERKFSPDGWLVGHADRLPNGNLESSDYRVDGTLISQTVRQANGFEDITVFFADGKTKRLTIKNYYALEAIYYRPSGEPEMKVAFTASGKTVEKYAPGSCTDQNGSSCRVVYIQTWNLVQQQGVDMAKVPEAEKKYKLSVVETRHANGKMKTKYFFDSEKGFVNKTWNYNEEGHNTHDEHIREDGTVSKIDYFKTPPNGFGLDHSVEVPAEKQMRPKFDRVPLQEDKFEDPRPYVKSPPPTPPVYQYGEGDYID